MTQPHIIDFSDCTVHIWPRDQYLETIFPDGTKVPASPQDNDEYRAKARAFGYGNDVWSMCLHHELAHTILAEADGLPYSPTLWAVAHGQEGDGEEERRVAILQQRMRQADQVGNPFWFTAHQPNVEGCVVDYRYRRRQRSKSFDPSPDTNTAPGSDNL